MSLPSVGAEVPNSINALLRKSPNVSKLSSLSTSTMKTDDTGTVLSITNNGSRINAIGHSAKKAGIVNALAGIRIAGKIFNSINKEL